MADPMEFQGVITKSVSFFNAQHWLGEPLPVEKARCFSSATQGSCRAQRPRSDAPGCGQRVATRAGARRKGSSMKSQTTRSRRMRPPKTSRTKLKTIQDLILIAKSPGLWFKFNGFGDANHRLNLSWFLIH